MSGSPSTKFIGRSFDDLTNAKGYKSEQGLAQPATQKSWLLAAHVRINGPFYDDANQGAPLGPILVNVDDLDTPTKGILLGFAVPVTGYGDNESGFTSICSIFGNGASASAGFQVTEASGGFGRDLFIHFWFDADQQEFYGGFNGKLHTAASLGEDFEPATDGPTLLGALEIPGSGAKLMANSGLVSIESVAAYEAPEAPDTLDAADVASAIASMAMASMKLGTLVLSDGQVPSAIEGIFAGKDWTHYWKPGTTQALAPETLPDSGDAAQNVPLTRECAADEAPLVIGDTGFASGEQDDFTTNFWDEAGVSYT
jgi:hypothetical protein